MRNPLWHNSPQVCSIACVSFERAWEEGDDRSNIHAHDSVKVDGGGGSGM